MRPFEVTGRMSVKSGSSDKQPEAEKQGDEAIISMSVAGKVTDNSIMEVGRSRPQFQYSREELMEIKNQPLSKRRPECLDISNNKPLDRKPSDTPPEDERTGRGEQVAENHGKRRSGDPRERIRKEQDGIVLSPQRRSFNSGCFVNVSQPPARRPESPIGKPEVSHREPVRRIGSGRILARNTWDFRENEKLEPERPEFTFRPGGGPLRERDSRDNRDSGRDRDRERDERNDRFERRSFGDRDRDRDRGNSERNERNDRNHPVDREKDRRDRRYGNDRRRTFSENKEPEEPEWFSSGPTSQHDTIELRGFEDIPEEKVVKIGSAKSKKQSSAQKKRGKKKEEKEEKQSEVASGPKGRSTPTAMDQPMNPVPTPHSPISERNERPSPVPKEKTGLSQSDRTEPSSSDAADNSSLNKAQENSHSDFNLDDFLKSDTFPGVPGLLTNGVGSNGSSGSRFSQWFKRESPVQQVDTRRASIQDELLNNLLNDITEPNIQIPSVTESNTYFAPISPANTTNNATPATGVKLLEMLQRGGTPSQNGQGDVANNVVPLMKNSSIKDMEVGGKVVHSLEELEARMRGGAPAPTAAETRRVNKTEDLSAFKKLLAQVTGGQAVPAANGPIPQKPQPIILMQVLNNQLKTQQQVAQQQQLAEQLHASTFNHGGPLGPAQHPHQAQVQHENLMKVLQIQQQQQKQRQQQQSDMLSLMLGSQRMVGVSPVPPDMQMIVNNAPSSRELLQRPEAQAIIKGLQQGEITKQHLIQQLQVQNPAIQHRHREVLVNILKLYGGTTPRTVSPHPVAPTPQDHILQQMLYQQQHQQQRIPSPMNTAYCPAPIISPNLAPSPNTLTVQHPVMQHRVPSPREIVMHTQSIIQNALIKKKLEEQQENFRKRQEQQQQQQRVSSPVISSTKQTLSPTPLAFTPTSVLRKMTAEKETEGNNDPTKLTAQSQAAQMQQMQSTVQLLAQGVLSRHAALRPQPVQPSWSNPTIKQHPGRPIVRGGGGNQFHHSSNIDFQQQQQQQQQQRATSGIYGNPARSKHTMATPLPMSNVPQYNVNANPVIGQRANHMNNHMKSQHVQSHLSMQQQPQQQQQPRSVNPQLQQIVMNQNYNSARTEGRAVQPQQMNMGVGRQASPGLGYMGSNGGDLSPTSNQLARWFSPELLAQARAGKLPDLGHSNVLSLEDLERLQHASTTVHN